jgi:hypothetical protein
MICVFGGKGAPGASTVALLLAALWPDGGVLVEADPAGGDAALRLSGPSGQVLPNEPNLTRLAVDTATDLSHPDLEWVLRCALQTATGIPVVCGLTTGAGMTQTMIRYAAPLASRLSPLREVIVDAGRLTPASPALPLAAAASAVLLVVADGADYFYAARELLGELLAGLGGRSIGPVAQAAVVCSSRRGPAATGELATALAARGLPVEVAGWVARDPGGLRRFLAGEAGAHRADLLRTAGPLTAALIAAVGQPGLSADPAVVTAGSGSIVAGATGSVSSPSVSPNGAGDRR